MYYVYLLKLSNQDTYVGYTLDLKKRLKEHISGKSPHTRKFRPIELIHYSSFKNKKKALDFETYLKSGSGIAFRTKHLI